MKKYTFNDAKNEFDNRGYILLSNEEEYKNVSSKLRYLCPKHIDKGEMLIDYGHLKSGRGCYYCGRLRTESSHLINLDFNYYQSLCESKGFTYIDTVRHNGKIKIKFICPKHSDLGDQLMVADNMKRDIKGCKYCGGHSFPKWYIQQQINMNFPYITLLDDYTKSSDIVKYRCNKHNIESKTAIGNILRGRFCVECGKEKVSSENFLTINEYQERINKFSNHIKVIEYNGMRQNAKFQCGLCNYEWYSSAMSMVVNGRQCPNCENYYVGEKKVEEFLKKIEINYIPQYRFPECKDKRSLPFDFYLYDCNTCIEYDGRHHFNQIKHWNHSETFKHDKIKDKYCKDNGINLIRIPYWIDDIDYYLFDELVKLNIIQEINIA